MKDEHKAAIDAAIAVLPELTTGDLVSTHADLTTAVADLLLLRCAAESAVVDPAAIVSSVSPKAIRISRECAESAFATFKSEEERHYPGHSSEPDSLRLVDLLIGLRHMARDRGLDFDVAAETAAEQAAEEFDPGPNN